MKRIPALVFCCVLALAALLLPWPGDTASAACAYTCSTLKGACQQGCFASGCTYSFSCNSVDPCASTCRCTNCQP